MKIKNKNYFKKTQIKTNRRCAYIYIYVIEQFVCLDIKQNTKKLYTTIYIIIIIILYIYIDYDSDISLHHIVLLLYFYLFITIMAKVTIGQHCVNLLLSLKEHILKHENNHNNATNDGKTNDRAWEEETLRLCNVTLNEINRMKELVKINEGDVERKLFELGIELFNLTKTNRFSRC